MKLKPLTLPHSSKNDFSVSPVNVFRNKITQPKVNVPTEKLILPSATKITDAFDADYEFVSIK